MAKFKCKEAYEHYEGNVSEATRKYCKEKNIPYKDSYRRNLSYYISKNKFELDNTTSTQTNQYANDKESKEVFMPSAWDEKNQRFLNIDQFCDKYNLPKEQVRSSKLVAHQKSHMTYNIAFNATIHEQTGIDEEFITSVIKKHIKPVVTSGPSQTRHFDWFDRLVYTDVHIGMDPSGSINVEPLYEGKWDKEEILRRLDVMINHVKRFQKGNVLVIDDLGDFLDGLGGQTTRKGHHLPQNMSDKEVFELGIYFKIYLVDNLINYYDKIICNSVTEDNHSGLFSYFVNKPVKDFLNERYGERVEVRVLNRFIEHYKIDDHTFILTHGKDSESLKFGFKPQLDTKQIEKIDQYLKEYKLYDGNNIEFSKGDSHQAIFDDTTSNDFVYYNYPAFSPPSNWVKSNFKNSKSGFVFYNIDRESPIKVKIPYYF